MAWNLILCLLILFITGCSSAFKVTSEPPDAEVALKVGENAERKIIGKTPLNMPYSEVSKAVGKDLKPGEFITLEVVKPGFVTESLNIPGTRFGTTLTEIQLKLKPDSKTGEDAKSANDILTKLFLAQKFANSQQFERALIELDQLLTQYPKFARALSMKGSIYLVQKRYDESLKWYEEALKADPQMEDTVKLSAKVRELMSGRKPASP